MINFAKNFFWLNNIILLKLARFMTRINTWITG